MRVFKVDRVFIIIFLRQFIPLILMHDYVSNIGFIVPNFDGLIELLIHQLALSEGFLFFFRLLKIRLLANALTHFLLLDLFKGLLSFLYFTM